jgi:biotin transporter BioY
MKLFTLSLIVATMAGYAAAGMDMQIDFPFVPVPVVFPRVSTQNLQVCLLLFLRFDQKGDI